MEDNSKLDSIRSGVEALQEAPKISPNTQEDYERSPNEQKLLEQIADLKSNREMREKYADRAYEFAKYTIAFWMFITFVFFLTKAQPGTPNTISDTAFGILTTACTVNILVAFHAVIKGLFSISQEHGK